MDWFLPGGIMRSLSVWIIFVIVLECLGVSEGMLAKEEREFINLEIPATYDLQPPPPPSPRRGDSNWAREWGRFPPARGGFPSIPPPRDWDNGWSSTSPLGWGTVTPPNGPWSIVDCQIGQNLRKVCYVKRKDPEEIQLQFQEQLYQHQMLQLNHRRRQILRLKQQQLQRYKLQQQFVRMELQRRHQHHLQKYQQKLQEQQIQDHFPQQQLRMFLPPLNSTTSTT